MKPINPEFIRGFADTLGIPEPSACEQWEGFSRQLSDRERLDIEAGGYIGGRNEARLYRRLYPSKEGR